MTTRAPTAVDLFCGAGGFSTGLTWAGFDIKWAIDSNEDAIETYRRNHDNVECESTDIRDVTFPEFESPIDLVAGGPPCPTFSIIGRSKLNSLDGRNAATDSRTQLWERFHDAVEHYNPRVFVMENVEGMVSAMNEHGESVLKIIRESFQTLGYQVTHSVVDAADFGVPQHRRRLFIIGNRIGVDNPKLRDWRSHREPISPRERQARFVSHDSAAAGQYTFSDFGMEKESEDHPSKQPSSRVPWVTVAEAISDLPPLSPGGDRADSTYPPVTAEQYELPPVTQYQEWARADAPTEEGDEGEYERLYNHEARYHNLTDLSIYKLLGEGTGWRIGDLPDELQPYRSDVFSDNYTKQKPDEPSSTITAHIAKDGHMNIHPHEARSLTVREAARLQSFPDRFVFPVSRTAAYKQVGNAVPPLLAESIGNAILDLLERE